MMDCDSFLLCEYPCFKPRLIEVFDQLIKGQRFPSLQWLRYLTKILLIQNVSGKNVFWEKLFLKKYKMKLLSRYNTALSLKYFSPIHPPLLSGFSSYRQRRNVAWDI